MLNPALRKLTIISGLVLIMTGCKEPGFQTKANSQLDLSQTHAINDNDNVVNRTISKGDKTRIISVKNKYRSNTLAPATQVTQPKLEKADDFVVKSTSDSEILMYGDHEMLVKPDKIIVDPDDNEIKFRFANSLERHQRKALSQILNLFDNKKELGKPLVTFYEDLSTNFFMQNTRLIDEIGVNAGNYRHVVTSQACWLEAKNHCLLYYKDQLKILAVRDIEHNGTRFITVFVKDLQDPSGKNKIASATKSLTNLAQKMVAKAVIFSLDENYLLIDEKAKIKKLRQLYEQEITPESFEKIAIELAFTQHGFFYVQPNTCAVRAVGQAEEWKFPLNIPGGEGIGYFLCDTTGNGFANRVEKIKVDLGGIGIKLAPGAQYLGDDENIAQMFNIKQLFELNVEGLSPYPTDNKEHDIFACDFATGKVKSYWGEDGIVLSGDYSGCHPSSNPEGYSFIQQSDRDTVVLKNLNFIMVAERTYYDLLSINIETLRFSKAD